MYRFSGGIMKSDELATPLINLAGVGFFLLLPASAMGGR